MNRKKIKHGVLRPIYEKHGAVKARSYITISGDSRDATTYIFNEPWQHLSVYIEHSDVGLTGPETKTTCHVVLYDDVRIAYKVSYKPDPKFIDFAVDIINLSDFLLPIQEDYNFKYATEKDAHYHKNIMLEIYTSIVLDKPEKLPSIEAMRTFVEFMAAQHTAQKLADL